MTPPAKDAKELRPTASAVRRNWFARHHDHDGHGFKTNDVYLLYIVSYSPIDSYTIIRVL